MANTNGGAATGGALYGLGIFGAWAYYWTAAEGVAEHLYAIFQGVFWPAYMVFETLAALHA